MTLDWDAIARFACTEAGGEIATYYGKPAVKANGRPLVTAGTDDSFVLHIDTDTKAMLLETDPDTFWQTPHYEGWPCLLVRYAGTDPERVLANIALAADQACSSPAPKARRR